MELPHSPECQRHQRAAAKLIVFSFKFQPFLVNPRVKKKNKKKKETNFFFFKWEKYFFHSPITQIQQT